MSHPTKTCASCGREIEYRKRWAKTWDDVKYCSDQCRKNKKPNPYVALLLTALSQKPRGTQLDPLEVLAVEDRSNAIRVEQVRSAARLLQAEGHITILQNSKPVDPSRARGPFKVRLV